MNYSPTLAYTGAGVLGLLGFGLAVFTIGCAILAALVIFAKVSKVDKS